MSYRNLYLGFYPDSSQTTYVFNDSDISTKIGYFTKIKLNEITISLTYYAISSINNSFALIENDGLSDTTTQCTITQGTYTLPIFATTIKNILNTASSGYDVVYDNNTNKITISLTGGNTFKIDFYSGNNGTTDDSQKRLQAQKIWGISRNKSTSNAQISDTDGSTITSWESTNPVILWGPDYLYLKSSQLKKILISYNYDNLSNDDIIAKIPIVGSPFTQLTYKFQSDFVLTNHNSLFPTQLVLNLTDETNNKINLNDGGCYLTFIFI